MSETGVHAGDHSQRSYLQLSSHQTLTWAEPLRGVGDDPAEDHRPRPAEPPAQCFLGDTQPVELLSRRQVVLRLEQSLHGEVDIHARDRGAPRSGSATGSATAVDEGAPPSIWGRTHGGALLAGVSMSITGMGAPMGAPSLG
jgi:hypothetical protein